MLPSFIFRIYILTVLINITYEAALVCLQNGYELPQFSLFCPQSVKTWQDAAQILRHIIVMILCTIIVLISFLHPDTLKKLGIKADDDRIETGIFLRSFGSVLSIFGIVTIMIMF